MELQYRKQLTEKEEKAYKLEKLNLLLDNAENLHAEIIAEDHITMEDQLELNSEWIADIKQQIKDLNE